MIINNNLDCEDFKKGRSIGPCEGMGHYLCDICKWRLPKYKRKPITIYR